MVARSVSVILLLFYVWVCLLPPSLLCVSVTLSTDSCVSFPVSAVFICRKKWSKGVFLVFLLLFLPFSLFSPLFSYFSALFFLFFCSLSPLSRSSAGFLVSKKSLLSFPLFCLHLLFFPSSLLPFSAPFYALSLCLFPPPFRSAAEASI